MADRPTFSPLAAFSLWLVALVGSWAMATAIVGALSDAFAACSSPEPLGWVVLGFGALVPVLVMVAVAPARFRLGWIAAAIAVAAIELVAWNAWIGNCLG